MPNWCMNNVTVSHEDPEMMLKFKAAFEADKLFETMAPLSTKDGQWDYGTAVDEWGTKWHTIGGDFSLDEGNKSGTGWFDTAWSPPIGFYETLAEQGFEINATYMETGMGFAGSWSNDDGDDCYNYDFSDPDWRDDIDNGEVVDMLESEYEAWLEWQEDEEEEDDGTDEDVSAEGSAESSK